MPNKIMTGTIWIIFLCMTKQTEQEQADVQSWCSVNEIYKGDETTLTCSFDQDVSTSKQNIILQHKTANGFEDILTYDWATGRYVNKSQDYHVQLEGNVTNSLTVNMNVRVEHGGDYRCVVGATEGKECKLIIIVLKAGLSPFEQTMLFIAFLYISPVLVFLVVQGIERGRLQRNSKSAQDPSIETPLVNVTVDNIKKGLQEESDAKDPLIGGISENENGHTQSDAKDPLIGGILENENENDHQSDEEENISLTHSQN